MQKGFKMKFNNLAIVFATLVLTAGITYSATLLSVRFKDMQATIQANAACTDFYAKAIAPTGRLK